MITLARRAEVSLPERTSNHPYNYWLRLAQFRIVNSSRPPIVHALPFAEQVRRALIRNRVDTSHAEARTGKRINGVPLEGHEHAHYFPTDDDGDGRLDYVTIYCPRGFDEADVEALGSLRTIYGSVNRSEVRMRLIGLGTITNSLPQSVLTGSSSQDNIDPLPEAVLRNSPLRSGYCPVDSGIFDSAKRWRSVTPFSLPRFPNRGGGKPPRPRDLPEAQLTQELTARGLPAPISIKRIEGYQANGRPMVRWLEFHTQRFKGTQGKGLAGFEIEFAEPVAGPIAVGFGCHFGLGLFMPC